LANARTDASVERVTNLANDPWSRRRLLRAGGAALSLLVVGRTRAAAADPPAPGTGGTLSPEQLKQLADAQFIYIQSTRKDGTLGKPAEIWFTVMDGAVWVGSAPSSWRAKRIRWKRPQVRIAIGSTSGPSLRATGSFVKDATLENRFCDQLAVKYPAKWSSWEKSFRGGFASGERVLIRYTPVAG
jgi:hypothetical protein